MTGEERTTATGLARYAYEYIDAAMLVDRHHGARKGYEFISPIPAYFLMAHGIELTLKAFLQHKGVTVKELRSYSHNLDACYRKAKELGLHTVFKITPNDTKAMTLLMELNKDMGLRYIRTGLKEFPSWAIVEPFAVRLHQSVAPLVGYKTFSIAYAAATSSPT